MTRFWKHLVPLKFKIWLGQHACMLLTLLNICEIFYLSSTRLVTKFVLSNGAVYLPSVEKCITLCNQLPSAIIALIRDYLRIA